MDERWRVLAGGEGGGYGYRGEDGEGGEGGQVVPLWMTKAEACERLGCSDRTLVRRVQRGDVERRQIGREARYRIARTFARRSPATLARGTAPRPSPEVARVGASLVDGETIERLVARVEQLAARVAELEQAEAVAGGASTDASRSELVAGPGLAVPMPILHWAREIGLRAAMEPSELLTRALRIGLEELGEIYPEPASSEGVEWGVWEG